LCNFLHSPVTSSPLGPNIPLSTLLSDTPSLRSSLSDRDQASHLLCSILQLSHNKKLQSSGWNYEQKPFLSSPFITTCLQRQCFKTRMFSTVVDPRPHWPLPADSQYSGNERGQFIKTSRQSIKNANLLLQAGSRITQ
jgi:hypothetical protein